MAIGTTMLSLSWGQMILGVSGLAFVYVRQPITFHLYNYRTKMKEKKKGSHTSAIWQRSSIPSVCKLIVQFFSLPKI